MESRRGKGKARTRVSMGARKGNSMEFNGRLNGANSVYILF